MHSGTKTTSITAMPMQHGRVRGAASSRCRAPGWRPTLPNELPAACTSDDTGFHSAKTRSTVGNVSLGTNAFETNVSGNRIMNEALLIVSGVFTLMPSSAITQLNA